MNGAAMTTLGQLNTATIDALNILDEFREAYYAATSRRYPLNGPGDKIIGRYYDQQRGRLAGALQRANDLRGLLTQQGGNPALYTLVVHTLETVQACMTDWVVTN